MVPCDRHCSECLALEARLQGIYSSRADGRWRTSIVTRGFRYH